MPSLLSRFLGKKKITDNSPLLDGEKFEAVPKTLSPSAPTFSEAERTKSKEKEPVKIQGKRQKRTSGGLYDTQLAESVPVLSLNLPDTKDEEKKSQGLGVVFEGITDGPKALDDDALGEKRLSPSETLVLVQKTSEVLVERGLETLGVMRPHWFASPRQQEIQLKLIHCFLETQAMQKAKVSSSSPTSQSTFESELRYSRDPHDVAAVLRWGLRHLQLEGNSFALPKCADWYRAFTDSERSRSYPIKAFDEILVPLLPAAHADLLRATLDLVSSLAAHSEENGISGNKLSKVLGWWILSSRTIPGARWPEFYAQWESAARKFEHVFLAYIRAQDAQSKMPKRLTELVKNYPFTKNRRDEDGIYLPRTRFSTRSTEALFVSITVDKSYASSRPHPLRLVEDAFRATADGEVTGPYATFWEEIRKVASQSSQSGATFMEEDADQAAESPLNLSAVLADESIRLFSLVPAPEGAILSLFTPLPSSRGRRSLSVGDRSPTTPTPTAKGQAQWSPMDSLSHNKAATSPQSSSQGHDATPDWQAFSSSGFDSPSGLSLAASLWDNDTEVSRPATKKTLSKRNLSKIESARPKSAELPAPTQSGVESSKPRRRTYGAPRIVTLDEAFIDFWADSLLDTIARTWPTFVLCQLKPLPALKRMQDGKPIEWLVIERVVAEPARPAPLKTSSASARAASPLPSPTHSDASKVNRWTSSTLSATRKRWSFFASRHDSAPAVQGGRDRLANKVAMGVKVGEMGEILKENGEGTPNGAKVNGKASESNPKMSADVSEDVLKPPVIQVNGVRASDDPMTSPKANAHQALESTNLPGSGLSPIEEDVSQQIAEPFSLENLQIQQQNASLPSSHVPAADPALTEVNQPTESLPETASLAPEDTSRTEVVETVQPEHEAEATLPQTDPVASPTPAAVEQQVDVAETASMEGGKTSDAVRPLGETAPEAVSSHPEVSAVEPPSQTQPESELHHTTSGPTVLVEEHVADVEDAANPDAFPDAPTEDMHSQYHTPEGHPPFDLEAEQQG